MSKKLFLSILLTIILVGTKAQKGNNAISINGEASIPVYQNNQGFGFFAKGLYGIGKSAQLTLSIGISRFTTNDIIEQGDIATRLIPFLLGYKQNIHRFFIEPQIGLGELGGRIKMGGDYARPSVAAVFGAIGAGYTFKKFTTGLRFQTAHGIEGSAAGVWHDENFHYTSVFIGYYVFSKRLKFHAKTHRGKTAKNFINIIVALI